MVRLQVPFVFASIATVALASPKSVGPWGMRIGSSSFVLSIPAGGDLDGAKSAAIQSASEKVRSIGRII